MVAMSTHRVTAEHTPRGWWVLESDNGAVSQVRRLDQAEDDIREAVAYLEGVPEDDVDIEIAPLIPDEVREALENAGKLRQEAQRANTDAAGESRRPARTLAAQKYTYRDIGAVMHISHQRAAQLVKS